MNKTVRNVIIVVCMCLGAISGIYCYNKLNKNHYSLNIPACDNIISISLEDDTNKVEIDNEKDIEELINVICSVKRTTSKESIQDAPVNVNYLKVDFKNKEGGVSTLFIYQKKKSYCIEQPYNGIYEITKEEYNKIVDYLNK